MDFDHEEELLDWDMQTDENFDDALKEDHIQNEKKVTERKPQQHYRKNPQVASGNWVKFDEEHENATYHHSTERRCGDGDSITSQEQGNIDLHDTSGSFNRATEPQRNSFSKSPSKFSSEYHRFTVLNEEENDLGGFDVSPMEFRGTLTTGNAPYKTQGSTCCKAIRCASIVMISLAFGILIGFYIGQGSVTKVVTVNDKPTTAAHTTSTVSPRSTSPPPPPTTTTSTTLKATTATTSTRTSLDSTTTTSIKPTTTRGSVSLTTTPIAINTTSTSITRTTTPDVVISNTTFPTIANETLENGT